MSTWSLEGASTGRSLTLTAGPTSQRETNHMITRMRRGGLAAILVLTLAAVGLGTAPAASADTIIPVSWHVNASTHIKSLNMDVVVPPGTFDGTIDINTGALQGTLSLPPATSTIKIFGLSLASATFAIQPTGPVTGHVDLATMKVTVNSSFNFLITKVTPSFLPRLNLVGNTCRGSKPVTVSMSGNVNLAGPSTFTSTYAIPSFTGCGLVTPLLNLIVPGAGNTFTATFAP